MKSLDFAFVRLCDCVCVCDLLVVAIGLLVVCCHVIDDIKVNDIWHFEVYLFFCFFSLSPHLVRGIVNNSIFKLLKTTYPNAYVSVCLGVSH